eukprot:GHVN01066754.1.p1 GENE.GHVN01066754.1~~GHVN01066754.1.p1  ORF type:complete len:246 (-),score=26.71 GHVN01066754.1:556-1293(-)
MLVIGMLGFGVVGGGTVELLERREAVRFKSILVQNLGKPRSAALPSGCKLTLQPDDVLDDPEINLIVEVMGGVDLAWKATQKAIKLGKHVVTANKALISLHLDTIQSLLKERPNQMFMYEAAVCGGIPVVATIQRCCVLDIVTSISGIMNGTTNFMLTKMEREGSSYEEALLEAKTRGYAEADPSADVEGWDARSKLCILCKLAFGCTVDEKAMYCAGVRSVTSLDVEIGELCSRMDSLLHFFKQ